MNKTVGEHIRELEDRRQSLERKLSERLSSARREEIDASIRAINLAISYFRSAIETEQQLDET